MAEVSPVAVPDTEVANRIIEREPLIVNGVAGTTDPDAENRAAWAKALGGAVPLNDLEDTQELEPVKPRGRFACGCGFNIADDSEGEHAYREFEEMVQEHIDSCPFGVTSVEVRADTDVMVESAAADADPVSVHAESVVSDVRSDVQKDRKYTPESFLNEPLLSHLLKGVLHGLHSASEHIALGVPTELQMQAVVRVGESKARIESLLHDLGWRDKHKIPDRGDAALTHAITRLVLAHYQLNSPKKD